jgi:serine/threonine-protein kinase HipA
MARSGDWLAVSMNGRRVGQLARTPGGALAFQYDQPWLQWPNAVPVSQSMPLREERYSDPIATTVFDNLLPDNFDIRRYLAERTGAEGTDAFSLLRATGRDCAGALHFVPEDMDAADPAPVQGSAITDAEIEAVLLNLSRFPLGTGYKKNSRIVISGTQPKTALLRRNGRWECPAGATATTHILKAATGSQPDGIGLSTSIENEHFCLTLSAELGLPAARSEIAVFGETQALVIERFDRVWSGDRLLRRPQEDLCQALGVPWTRRYEVQGGPGIRQIAALFQASDEPEADRKEFLAAQILFWLLGATNGHAKNFSIHLSTDGRFALAPLYDVLSAQPGVDIGQIPPEDFRLAMAVGDERLSAVNDIGPRHFTQMAGQVGLRNVDIEDIFAQLVATVPSALERTIAAMPPGFPARLARSIVSGVTRRLRLVT